MDYEGCDITFEEISDPKNALFDPYWYESDLVPLDHEWIEIIGDFLFMRAMINQKKLTGKNSKLKQLSKNKMEKFISLIEDIEHFIKYQIDGIEFAEHWSAFKSSFEAISLLKIEQRSREKRGQYDRGSERRKAWYALVYIDQASKGIIGAQIKWNIAKYAELIRNNKIPAPKYWQEGKFERILHRKSTDKGPRLALNIEREMNVKEDIPYYAKHIAPKYKLPALDIKTSI